MLGSVAYHAIIHYDATMIANYENNLPIGTLYIIAAASGTGKTSLARALVNQITDIKISISHTTRPMRRGEIADQDYFFVSQQEFADLSAKQEFLEHAMVFDNHYGTSKNWVKSQLNLGIDVILDIDWQGAQLIRQQIACTSIFLLPPSRNELQMRLEKRQREDAAIITHRMNMASSEISHCKEFDYIVINDKFEAALADLVAIISSKRLERAHQMPKHAALINDLIKT